MRVLLLFLFFSCVNIFEASAQKLKTFKVKPGEKVIESIPRDEMYSHPEFPTGTVYLRNNTFSVARMSYNALFGEMQFVGPNGDTISIADEKNIKLIAINTDTFCFDDVYLKIMLDEGDVKLGNRRFIRFINREKLNGFGESTGGSIDTYSALSSSSYLKELVASELLTLATDNVLYIGDKFYKFEVANKKNLLELYAKQGKEVEKYVKLNKVNFSSQEDLTKLIRHFKTGN